VSNEEIANHLEEVADLLDLDPKANRYRVAAYRDAASTLRQLEQPAADLFRREGQKGLRQLHGIGEGLAGSIAELIETGRLGLLDRLREESNPEQAIATLPGIGPVLAARIHQQLGVETLPELEQAAQEGRLDAVPGVGPVLEGQIREALEARLRRRPAREGEPPVEELLSVDREYREKAEAGRLRTIAPRRFNPEGEAWLPVLQTRHGDRRYTALYSNTALAHELGKTRDWVVLYYARPAEAEEQVTVVTENQGRLAGRRVVRGREQECLRHYREQGTLGRAA
jgi:DNA polymerase (family 10)